MWTLFPARFLLPIELALMNGERDAAMWHTDNCDGIYDNQLFTRETLNLAEILTLSEKDSYLNQIDHIFSGFRSEIIALVQEKIAPIVEKNC